MTRDDGTGVDLIPVDGREAARIASGTPSAQDRWAEGFPRKEDSGPAARVVAAAVDPGPFGIYKLVPRAHGKAVGTAGFYGPPDTSGEVTVGYGMVESEWGRGYGTAALAFLVSVCRAHGGVTVINADTDLDNVGSRRVLEKNGFQKLRSSGTSHYYALPLTSSGG